MITLSFHFPAGRYHATPWGHHVNEGLVEWPPCPWRILRALIATGYGKLHWTEIPPLFLSLLQRMSGAFPVYSLPAVSMAHSRHYMPLDSGKTTLVLDTWLNVEGPLQVQWPVSLSNEEQSLLQSLVSPLNYLGRSESWVEAYASFEEKPLHANCYPHNPDQARNAQKEELMNLLIPQSEELYTQWREEQLPLPEEGKQTVAKEKARHKLEAPYPQTVLDAMQWDTAQWKGFGWNLPPGSQWVQYRRPVGCLDSASTVQIKNDSTNSVDLFLLSLSTLSGNLSALPTVARTLPQAELLHKALVSKADRWKQGIAPPELTGLDETGKPLEGHSHTHILPVDLDQDGHLDHVLLWAPRKFSMEACLAILSVRKTWTKGGSGDLHVAVAGHAELNHLQDFPEPLRPSLGKGTQWSSLTPFVPPRYLKKAGKNSLEGQILAELSLRNFPVPLRLEVKQVPDSVDLPESQRSLFRHFIRRRGRGGVAPPQDAGFFVRLVFGEEVQGPICLGYGSHFGMGVFRCEDAV